MIEINLNLFKRKRDAFRLVNSFKRLKTFSRSNAIKFEDGEKLFLVDLILRMKGEDIIIAVENFAAMAVKVKEYEDEVNSK